MNRTRLKSFGFSAGMLVVGFLFSGCAPGNRYTALRMHPDFAQSEKVIRTIVVLPPDVTFEQTETSGEKERLRDRECDISQSLVEHILHYLEMKGYTASEFQLEKFRETVEDADYQISQVRMAYDQASNELYEKSATQQEAEKYRVCMGPRVNQVAGEADAILFTRYYGFEKSKKQLSHEKIALGIQSVLLASLTGRYSPADPVKSGGKLEIALVDGTTGDVLWCNRVAGTNFGGFAADYALHAFPLCPSKDKEAVTHDPEAAEPAGSKPAIKTQEEQKQQ